MPSPINDLELDRLEHLLNEAPEGANPFSLDALQGFIAAVLSAPQPIPRALWMPVALGGDEDWTAKPETEELIRLIGRLEEDVQLALGEGDGILLYLYPTDDDEDELDVVPWVNGYLEGVGLAEPAWEESGDPETVDELLMPFVVLAGALQEDQETRDSLGLTAEQQAELIEECRTTLGSTVQEAYDYWFDLRVPATQRRDGPKVGRNDPCPCGSGKKYKQCCGAS
jgi:uncharacterized protein